MMASASCVRVACVLVLAVVLGCKETKVKDRPETLTALADCEKAKNDKDEYIKNLEKRVADFELKGAAGEVVVTIEGELARISGASGDGPNVRNKVDKGNARDTELYEAFLKAVRGSRGLLKKCYQSALKKNSALQAQTIPLKIEVRYRTDGKVASAQFSPRVSADFDRCMKGVADAWALPKMPSPVTFNSTITLTPE